MDCNDFAPFFLLYNSGELNGFGFAAFGKLEGTSRVEYPPQSAIRVCMCLRNVIEDGPQSLNAFV